MINGGIRDLDTHRLRAFVTVAETENMTRAAELMHQTQGAVSQQIRKLEKELGHILFERNRSGLLLTESGERLLVKARRILSLNDAIWGEMTTPRFAGAVTVGVPIDLAGGCRIGASLRAFTQRFPEVELNLRCGLTMELKEGLSSGEIDVAILEELPANQTGETLIADRLVWIGAVGGGAAHKDPIPLSVVRGTCVFRSLVFEALERAGRRYKNVFEGEHFDGSLATVRADLAISALISSRKPREIETLGEHAGLPLLPDFNITLETSKRRTRLAGALADHLRRELSLRQDIEYSLG